MKDYQKTIDKKRQKHPLNGIKKGHFQKYFTDGRKFASFTRASVNNCRPNDYLPVSKYAQFPDAEKPLFSAKMS